MACWWPSQDSDCVFSRGDVLADTYEIRDLLGAGAMGQVYEAYDRALGRLVAIKAARPSEDLPPLRHEAQAMAALRHPSLVAVHCMGVHCGCEYIVMERVYGMSLEAHLAQRRFSAHPFAVVETIELLVAVAGGLSAIHAAGIVHRDVKPANIMLAPGNRVVLMDFGTFLPEFDTTPIEVIAGTPLYIAPEAIRKSIAPGAMHLVDLYALGVIGYEMLTLQMPFDGESVLDILRQHLRAPVPDVRRFRADAPPRLAKLLADLLRKDPNERPQSADAVAWQLRHVHEVAEARPRPPLALIVDDDSDARAVLSMMVKRVLPGAEIHVASTAKAAIHLVHRKPPTLILLDLDLPGMNGVELCMYLRGARIAERARIVVVSGKLGDSERELLGQLGVREFIGKGSQVQELLPGILEEVGRIASRR